MRTAGAGAESREAGGRAHQRHVAPTHGFQNGLLFPAGESCPLRHLGRGDLCSLQHTPTHHTPSHATTPQPAIPMHSTHNTKQTETSDGRTAHARTWPATAASWCARQLRQAHAPNRPAPRTSVNHRHPNKTGRGVAPRRPCAPRVDCVAAQAARHPLLEPGGPTGAAYLCTSRLNLPLCLHVGQQLPGLPALHTAHSPRKARAHSLSHT